MSTCQTEFIDMAADELSADQHFTVETLTRQIQILQRQLAEQNAELRSVSERLASETSAHAHTEQAHQETLEQLEATMGALPDMLLETDRDGRIHDYHAPQAELLYTSPENFLGRTMADVLPEPAGGIVSAAIARASETGKPTSATYPLQTPTGAGWFEISIAPKGDPTREDGRLVALVRDVTARQQALDEVRRQKRFLERAIEALNHPFYVINVQDYTIELANATTRNLARRAGATTCYALSHDRDRPCDGVDHSCPLQQVLRTKQPATMEHIHLDADGKPYEVEVHGYPILDDDGNVVRMIEYCLDITARKEVERTRRQTAATAERERLANDLHDAVSQNLFSAGLIAELLPQVWELDQDEARRNLGKLRQLIRAAAAETRTLLLEFRPGSFAENDLNFLLDHLAENLTARADIDVNVDLDEACDLSPATKMALYRIVQEAFNNIVKHAQAGRASLRSRCRDGRVSICVRDDGRGFDPDAIPPGHLGVCIMHERAAHIGAQLNVESATGQGTRITLVWEEMDHD